MNRRAVGVTLSLLALCVTVPSIATADKQGSGNERGTAGDHAAFVELQQAFDAFEARQFETAALHYQRASDVADGDAFQYQAFFGLGTTYAALGRHAEAVASLERARELRPDHGETLYLLGTSYAAMGSTNAAVVTLEEAVRRSPDLVPAHRELSILYARLGWHEEAAGQCRELLELDETDVEAQLGLAVAQYHLERYDEAIEEFERAIALGPENPRCRFGLGLAYLMAGDRDQAIVQYGELKKIDAELARELYLRIFP